MEHQIKNPCRNDIFAELYYCGPHPACLTHMSERIQVSKASRMQPISGLPSDFQMEQKSIDVNVQETSSKFSNAYGNIFLKKTTTLACILSI